jgi:hypothetical protein
MLDAADPTTMNLQAFLLGASRVSRASFSRKRTDHYRKEGLAPCAV